MRFLLSDSRKVRSSARFCTLILERKFLKPHVKFMSHKICQSNIFQIKSLSVSVFSQTPCKDIVYIDLVDK